MWAFKGEYTGKAKTYAKKIRLKQYIGASVLCTAFGLLALGFVVIVLRGEYPNYVAVLLSSVAVCIVLINIILFLIYRRAPKCDIKIKNDGFYAEVGNTCFTFAFYTIKTIAEYDGFIIVKAHNKGAYVLQKELIVEGDWDEFEAFMKKVKDSLDTEDPIYQVEDPIVEYMEATVLSKRTCKEYVDIRMHRSVDRYFALFSLQDGKEVEYEIGKMMYEKTEVGQTGTLVLISEKFFDFGDGEDVEEIGDNS